MKRNDLIKKFSSNLEETKHLVLNECYNIKDLLEYYEIPYTSSNRGVLSNYLCSIGITILYPRVKDRYSRLICRYQDDINHWWDNKYLLEAITYKLKNNLVINYADKERTIPRYVIAVQGHPRASSSNQVKAHIILWELHNKKLFPDGYVLVPKDGNFTTLDINNFDLYTNEDYRSIVATGKRNHFYTTGSQMGVCYKGGWKTISKNIINNSNCSICGESNKLKLNVHHIINYHLFEKPKEAHFDDNLICLCDKCHQYVHLSKINLSGYISETRCKKLLEMLEKLREKYIDDKSKLDLVEFSVKSISSYFNNSSTTISKESTLQTIGNGSEKPLTDNAEGEDMV